MEKRARDHLVGSSPENEKNFYALHLGITTCYLLACTGGYLLIDTGFPKDYRKFMRHLVKHGVEKNSIRYLLLTHNHDDHVGFAARLKQETGARCIVHRSALAPLREGKMDEEGIRPLNGIISVLGTLHQAITRRDCRFEPLYLTDQDFILDDDEPHLLPRIGIDAEILYTPGHSSDSISVITSSGKAFCGDAAMNYLNFAGCRHRPIYLADEQLVFASWQKMLEKGAKIFYPAHGKPFAAERLMDSLRRFSVTHRSF
jgi:glyoxylase-like metal-dependent hydrolase (beta-lactamase superfamily II)